MPLFRLLAINLVIGVTAALLAVGGLLALDLYGLRTRILADGAPLAPMLLLTAGFIITFGSVAMGSAIMRIGRD
jgi:hypothetical protein